MNSVAGETELLISKDGRYERVTIGKFVDEHLANGAVEHFPNDTEYSTLRSGYKVLAADADGKVVQRLSVYDVERA